MSAAADSPTGARFLRGEEKVSTSPPPAKVPPSLRRPQRCSRRCRGERCPRRCEAATGARFVAAATWAPLEKVSTSLCDHDVDTFLSAATWTPFLTHGVVSRRGHLLTWAPFSGGSDVDTFCKRCPRRRRCPRRCHGSDGDTFSERAHVANGRRPGAAGATRAPFGAVERCPRRRERKTCPRRSRSKRCPRQHAEIRAMRRADGVTLAVPVRRATPATWAPFHKLFPFPVHLQRRLCSAGSDGGTF